MKQKTITRKQKEDFIRKFWAEHSAQLPDISKSSNEEINREYTFCLFGH